MTQSQNEARPQLLLLSKPSRAARRAAVQRSTTWERRSWPSMARLPSRRA